MDHNTRLQIIRDTIIDIQNKYINQPSSIKIDTFKIYDECEEIDDYIISMMFEIQTEDNDKTDYDDNDNIIINTTKEKLIEFVHKEIKRIELCFYILH